MKKYLLVVGSILFLLSVQGQTSAYKPFPTKNAIWTNRTGTVDYNNNIVWEEPIHYCMGTADTIIHSVSYSKINYCGGAYHGALRDENGKIYYIPADSSKELLIYDFTLKTDDSVCIYYLSAGRNSGPFRKLKCKNVRVSSILINGLSRKVIDLGGHKWIEGIGNDRGLFVESFVNVSGWATQLMCMSENDTTLFPSFATKGCSLTVGINESKNNPYLKLFPNPTSGRFQVQMEDATLKRIEVIDVLGRTIYSEQLRESVIDVNISAFNSGMYVVRVIDPNENVFVKRVIKE